MVEGFQGAFNRAPDAGRRQGNACTISTRGTKHPWNIHIYVYAYISNMLSDWMQTEIDCQNFYTDQAYRRPRGWLFSASWGTINVPSWYPSNTTAIGYREALTVAPLRRDTWTAQTSAYICIVCGLFRPVRSTFAVRETASLGIMGAPRVPPLNPSESIVLWEQYNAFIIEWTMRKMSKL